MEKEKAVLTCPNCQNKQELEIPTDMCLASYKCDSCGETISVPEGSENCCVICEYSDKTCPAPNKEK